MRWEESPRILRQAAEAARPACIRGICRLSDLSEGLKAVTGPKMLRDLIQSGHTDIDINVTSDSDSLLQRFCRLLLNNSAYSLSLLATFWQLLQDIMALRQL
jgi:hypothetical protein